jgi:hypothetical protein
MDDLRWLTAGACTAQQLRQTEEVLLLLLNWRLALPTAWNFHSQILADVDAGECVFEAVRVENRSHFRVKGEAVASVKGEAVKGDAELKGEA